MPKSVTYLDWTPIFGWYVVWYGSKNKYQKNISLKEIGLYVDNLMTILGSMVNTIERTYITHLMSLRISTFIMNKILI